MHRVEYGDTFFNAKDLRETAQLYLQHLPQDATHILSTGSSGCSIAAAMMVLAPPERNLKHCFVRRKGESRSAHSSGNIGWEPSSYDVSIVVDDFISTGKTIEWILKWDKARHESIRYILVSRIHDGAVMGTLLAGYPHEVTVINISNLETWRSRPAEISYQAVRQPISCARILQ